MVGAGVAATVVGIGVFLALGAPVTAKPGPPPPPSDTTTTTSSTTTTSTTSTSRPLVLPPPSTVKVGGVTVENPFTQQAPSSPGDLATDAAPRAEEPTTTTAAPSVPATPTTAPGVFARTSRRIVVTGVVLPAPEPVLGAAGAFARAYRTTGALAGVVAVRGTETIDYTTLTYAQLIAHSRFVGTLRSAGNVTLKFVTRVPRSTSFAGEEPSKESGTVSGMTGWKGTITMRYVASETGNSAGTYRVVFTRAHR